MRGIYIGTCLDGVVFTVVSSVVKDGVAAERDVLGALSQIIDPDFGTDIVSCGFVKDLSINESEGEVGKKECLVLLVSERIVG